MYTNFLFLSVILFIGGSNGQTACGANLQPCGNACYNPSEYTCYGTYLCPYENGRATQVCGDGACYDPSAYFCCNGQLYQNGMTCASQPTQQQQATQMPTQQATVRATQSATLAPTASATTKSPTAAAPTQRATVAATIVPATFAPSSQATQSQATAAAPTKSNACTAQSCGVGLDCCDRTYGGIACYNSSDFACLTDNSGTNLCASGFAICNGICYEPGEQQCCYGQLLQPAQICYAPTTPAPSQPPIHLGGQNLTADGVYNYYFRVADESSVSYLGTGETAFPAKFGWWADRSETYGNGLVLVFNAEGVTSVSNAVLVLEYQGASFDVVQTSCSDAAYQNCTSYSDMSCYPYRSYYDITICPCGNCQETNVFNVLSDATQTGTYFVPQAPQQVTEVRLGSVTFPLTVSLTNGENHQAWTLDILTSAVLNFS